jgi:hypothetical protein
MGQLATTGGGGEDDVAGFVAALLATGFEHPEAVARMTMQQVEKKILRKRRSLGQLARTHAD